MTNTVYLPLHRKGRHNNTMFIICMNGITCSYRCLYSKLLLKANIPNAFFKKLPPLG